MKRLLAQCLLVSILLFAGLSCKVAQEPSPADPNAETAAETVLPSGIRVLPRERSAYAATFLPDIPYAQRGDDELVLHLIAPRNALGENQPNRFPAILFVQGSAWRKQNLNAALPQLADFAHEGYIVASVQHQPSGKAQAPAQIQDVKSAIRFLRANSAQYNIDTLRIAIWGNSSGGHLAALAGTSAGHAPFETADYPGHSSEVSAVVDFYGPTDFLRMNDFPSRIDHDAPDSPESQVVGGPIQEPAQLERVQAYNPISYIDDQKDLPPFLIIHGDRDNLVPFNQSELLFEALTEVNADVTMYKIEGGGHGPGIWTPRVMKLVLQFLEKHLAPLPASAQQE